MPKYDPSIAHYQKELKKFFSEKSWIVATGVVVASVNIAKDLRKIGAKKVLAIGVVRGTGNIDDTDPNIEIINLQQQTATDMMAAIRKEEMLLADLPTWVHKRIERFDPKNQARVIGNIFSTHSHIAGRKVLGARPESWQKLENKITIDNFWDEVGIPRSPSEIVDIHLHSLEELTQEIVPKYDWGMGTVWAGDNKEGWHGGAKLLRWVRTSEQAKQAYDFFTDKCDHLRVMPFMNGLPCSIHGWNFSTETIALRPCEMLVFQQHGSSKLIYSGSSTNWKPTEKTRKQMQDVAIKVGKHLKKTIGYRGSFTVDGIVTKNGFRPTELNPRFGAALNRMSASFEDLPLYFLHLCTAEDIELDYRPKHLQKIIVETVEETPVSRGMYTLEGTSNVTPQTLELIPDKENGWKIADESAENTCSIRLGQAPSGALIFATVHPVFVKKGFSVAPLLASMFKFAGKQWNLEVAKLIPAPDVERW